LLACASQIKHQVTHPSLTQFGRVIAKKGFFYSDDFLPSFIAARKGNPADWGRRVQNFAQVFLTLSRS
jgi:hypothetical protein